MDTRVKWQLETSLSTVPREDIYYLGHRMDESRRLFHWGAGDEYNDLPKKLGGVFMNMTFDGYDWVFIADDDTYVFTKKLEEFVSKQSSKSLLVTGHKLDHIKKKWFEYYSGGSGTLLSHALYTKLCTYVKTCKEPYIHWCADICLGKWLIETNESVKKEGDIMIELNHPGFHPNQYDSKKNDITKAITFHHLKERKHYLDLHLFEYTEKVIN